MQPINGAASCSRAFSTRTIATESSRRSRSPWRAAILSIRNTGSGLGPAKWSGFASMRGRSRDGTGARSLVRASSSTSASASAQRTNPIASSAPIGRITELIVRDFGDWCLVDLAEEGGPLKRLAVARAEPRNGEIDGVPEQEPDDAVRAVVDGGNPQIVPALGERSNGQDPGGFLGGIDTSSLICVPVRARQRSIGAITVARTGPGQTYGADDLALVEDIAGRIALSVDRARLYSEVEQRSDAARVLAHVADGVLLLDRSGVVRLWNPAAEGITAIRAGDI